MNSFYNIGRRYLISTLYVERSFFIMVKKYKEILRYFDNGFSQRQIADLANVSRGTVIKTIDAFKAN